MDDDETGASKGTLVACAMIRTTSLRLLEAIYEDVQPTTESENSSVYHPLQVTANLTQAVSHCSSAMRAPVS